MNFENETEFLDSRLDGYLTNAIIKVVGADKIFDEENNASLLEFLRNPHFESLIEASSDPDRLDLAIKEYALRNPPTPLKQIFIELGYIDHADDIVPEAAEKFKRRARGERTIKFGGSEES